MKYLNRLVLLLIMIVITGCKVDSEKSSMKDEESIIDKTYKASGADKIENSRISFRFRDRYYQAERNEGKFMLNRTFSDSTRTIKDVYSNDGFTRFINEVNANVPDSMASRYKESVNSVHYFSVLPFGLRDAAVNTEVLGEVSIKGKSYNKLKITFDEEGGGKDFEDVFIYWINSDTNLIDYLAYEFHVDGGGQRFREAYNERFIEGIRIVDYKNYKPIDKSTELSQLDLEFEQGNLELLSTIDLVDVNIQLN